MGKAVDRRLAPATGCGWTSVVVGLAIATLSTTRQTEGQNPSRRAAVLYLLCLRVPLLSQVLSLPIFTFSTLG